ncbi:TlpA family protein disulfide reductase [Chitinophaga eiseniae]|uniref:TlpA family protein disulfide reductase n=1 Tax=Chitinophaga eiseniae TaxID=634771 RepID=A0A847SGR5_9BACT|nr:TlpA disulfide reductase family protein [Chitinophaga eiseniae]NLR78215.1 TlpA family protein disulfide reductase [Chitinophaga eiseniae]
MRYLRLIIFLGAMLSAFSSTAQRTYQGITLQLDTLKNLRDAPINIFVPEADQVWGTDNSIPDSILWKWMVQREYAQMKSSHKRTGSARSSESNTDTSGMNCPNLPDALYILTRCQHDTLTISLLRRCNPSLDLDKEIFLSYPIDSLKNWTLQNVPDGALSRITINYPHCINNKAVKIPLEFYLIPVKDKNASFSDNRVNQMPLFISFEKTRVTEFSNAHLYFSKRKYSSPDNIGLNIKIFENGAFHKNKIVNKLRYKDQYKMRDTFSIGSKLYQIDSISHNWQYAYLHVLKDSVQQIKLSPNSLKILAPYFKNSDKMIVDFWGTWCNPCIEKLPALKTLHQQTGEKYNFLSVCVDKPENTDKAKAIFSKNKIAWSQVFVDMSKYANSIVGELEVSCFPTYMIINKKGEITFSGCGTDGFNTLQQLTLKN